jgi:AcrR family transcriptional regulator
MHYYQRKRLPVDNRRTQLLELGREIFGEHPYDGITTDEITRLARISKGLLYHYFPSKRNYYLSTVQAVANDFLAATATAEQQNPKETLGVAIERFLNFVESNHLIYRSLVHGAIGSDPECSAILERFRDDLTARLLHISGAPRFPDQSLRIYGWLGTAEFMSLRWLETREISRDEVEDTLSAFAHWAIFGDGPDGIAV